MVAIPRHAPPVATPGGARGGAFGWLLRHVIGGHAARHRLRTGVQVLAIATGVALGYAVHLINASALDEFAAAVRQAGGQADGAVVGPREGFDESLFARVAKDPAVRLASPLLELELPVLAVLPADDAGTAADGEAGEAVDAPPGKAAETENGTLLEAARGTAGGVARGTAGGVARGTAGEAARGTAGEAARGTTGEAARATAGEVAGGAPARAARSAAASPPGPGAEVAADPSWRRPRVIGQAQPVLRIVGVDALRAALVTPHWVGRPGTTAARLPADRGADDAPSTAPPAQPPPSTGARPFALLDDGLYVSPAAARTLRVATGDRIVVQIGDRSATLRVAGDLPGARAGELVAAMDIGFAQWRLDRLGRLTRIDLVLAPGHDLAQRAAAWALPAGVTAQTPDAAALRMSNLSRAYRVNLNVLAMVALFTGAFLVFSLQSQAVLARQPQLAFLRIMGVSRGEVERLLLAESTLLGALGSLAGLAAGALIAWLALAVLGGDLGGGYFSGATPQLRVDPWMAALFFALGCAAATLGGWQPARAAAAQPPARALKAGSGLDARARPSRRGGWWPVGFAAAAAACLLLPPVGGVPVAAYVAVALLLVAAIGVKPWVAPPLFAFAARRAEQRVGSGGDAEAAAAGWLALTRLAAHPRFAAIGAAGIVASFALMVAMLTMVASFRGSVDDWLQRVLPADLYVRAGPLGAAVAFSPRDLQRLRTDPAVARVELSHVGRVSLAADRPPVALLARVIDRTRPERSLPLTGRSLAWDPSMPPPAWVSEAVVDLFGARPGGTLELPLAGRTVAFQVMGVWRDYARQFGSVIVDVDDYERITGDRHRTDAALWLAPGARAAELAARLGGELDARSAEFAEPGEIRAISLRLFDRSFAVTYVLQAAAIAIGLVGIAATFSAQAIARTREFGVLRHLGCTPRQILRVLAVEGLMVAAVAVAIGLVAGLAVAWVLVEVVNPQSFHWTMAFEVPVARIAALVAVLLAAAMATAVIAGRRAVAPGAILAVREDW